MDQQLQTGTGATREAQERGHRGLFSLLAQLRRASDTGQRRSMLASLVTLLEEHFTEEERLGGFFDNVCQAFPKHKALVDDLRTAHGALLDEVQQLCDTIDGDGETSPEVLARLSTLQRNIADHEAIERRLLQDLVRNVNVSNLPAASKRPVSDDAPPSAPPSNRLSGAPSLQPNSLSPPEDCGESLVGLQELVDPDTLSVVFQPIIEMATGRLFAHEALVRCSDRELSPPPVLFEAAVKAGCTGRLGRTIREIGVPLVDGERLFVNIHPQELAEGWLVRPDDPVFSHNADVYLEITESAAMTHADLCMSVLKEVASRVAVHLVVDDLGAGYSNLLRIADLEPAVVKLDRQLVINLDKNARKRELVSAVVDLCTRLGAEVVGEGVETVDEYLALLDTGVHYGQGFLFARPAFPIPTVPWPPGSASESD